MTATELPSDLRLPTPRPLPPWARRSHVSETIIALAALGTTTVTVAAREYLLATAILGVAGLVAIISWAIRRTRCQLLREGAAAAGIVEEIGVGGRRNSIRYRYETPLGAIAALGTVDRRLAAAVGDWPQPGDPVFVVFDPKGPSRNEVWSLAKGPSHDHAAAARFVRRWSVRAWLTLGAFLAVTCGLPTLSWLLRSRPPARVASCAGGYSHFFWAHLAFEDGSRFTVNENEMADLHACLPPGTWFEKRRGEFAYRVDGVARPVNGGSVVFPGLLGIFGCAAVIVGALRARSSRADARSPQS